MTDAEFHKAVADALALIPAMIEEMTDPDFENHNGSARERFDAIVENLDP